MNQSNELKLSLDLCQKAGDIAMKYWPGNNFDLKIDRKSDGSEVTEADRECERMLRVEIAKVFPNDGFLGEEEGESQPKDGQRRWIIDPIDGTFNFSKGIPVFSTLLALENNGEIVMGIVNAPAMKEMYWAEKNGGAFKNGKKIHASNCSDLSKAYLTCGQMSRIYQMGYWQGFTDLVNKTYRQKAPGDYITFGLVFEGKAEIAIETGVKPWDLAPMKILAQESGARYNDLSGSDSIYTGNCLVTNTPLHDQVLDCLKAKTAVP